MNPHVALAPVATGGVLAVTAPVALHGAWRWATGARVAVERHLLGDGVAVGWAPVATVEALAAGRVVPPPGAALHLLAERWSVAGGRPTRHLLVAPVPDADGRTPAADGAGVGSLRAGGTWRHEATRVRTVAEHAPAAELVAAGDDVWLAVDAAAPWWPPGACCITLDALEAQRLASYGELRAALRAGGAACAAVGHLVLVAAAPRAGAGRVAAALVGAAMLGGPAGALVRRRLPPRPPQVDLAAAPVSTGRRTDGPGVAATAGAPGSGSGSGDRRTVRPGGVAASLALAAAGLTAGVSRPVATHPAWPTAARAVAVATVAAAAGADWWLGATMAGFGRAYREFRYTMATDDAPYGARPVPERVLAAVEAEGHAVYRNRFRFVPVDGALRLVSGVDGAQFPSLRYRYRHERRGDGGPWPAPGEAVVSSSYTPRPRLGDRLPLPVATGAAEAPTRHPTVVGVLDDPTWAPGVVVLDRATFRATFGGAGASAPLVATRMPLGPDARARYRLRPTAGFRRSLTRSVGAVRLPLVAAATGATVLGRVAGAGGVRWPTGVTQATVGAAALGVAATRGALTRWRGPAPPLALTPRSGATLLAAGVAVTAIGRIGRRP